MAIKCVSLEYIKPGSVLAKNVNDNNGRILCSSGTVVTELLLSRFEKMEIESLHIEVDDKITEELYLNLKSQIEKRFSRVGSKNIMFKLKLALLANLEKRKEAK